jgi:plasmid stabilization system protein ParE
MEISWSAGSVENLQAIHDYHAPTSPAYAARMLTRLIDRTEQIAKFPRSGRVVPEMGTDALREVIESPYRLIYRVSSREVEIVAIVHASRDISR